MKSILKVMTVLVALGIAIFTFVHVTALAEPPEMDFDNYKAVYNEDEAVPVNPIEPKVFVTAPSTRAPYDITGKTAATITADLQSMINAASPGSVITVNGVKNNENAVIELENLADKTVVWRAESQGLSFYIDGSGTFEVAEGGLIEVTGKDAIVSDFCNVVISGGEVTVLRNAASAWLYLSAVRITGSGNVLVTGGKVSTTRNSSAIYLEWGNVTVKGGELSTVGETVSGIPTSICYTVRVEERGMVVITGGKVSATGATYENHPVDIGWGLAACLDGTCEGEGGDLFGIYYWYYGAVVKVQDWANPMSSPQHGMSEIIGGDAADKVYWDTTGEIPLIRYDFNGYEYSVPWVIPEDPAGPTNPYPVELYNGASTLVGEYDTLDEAMAEAASGYTLQVVGNVTEPNNVVIDKSVTIKGDGYPRTVTLVPGVTLTVQSGATLTLGDNVAERLTIASNYNTVVVTYGSVNVKDGVTLTAQSVNATVLLLSGAGAGGEISGGRFEGNTCVALENGAQLSEISGGRFIGKEYAVYLKDADTKIGEISSGTFYQTESTHGHTVLVYNKAQIDLISGGYFEAVKGVALTIQRGAKVGEIRAGEFTAPPTGTMATTGWNAAVWIQNDSMVQETGIDLISGGRFYGSHFGVITMYSGSNVGSYITEITGGTFEGIVGLQNDVRGYIGTISGGDFLASQGMLNVGTIDLITGTANFVGSSSYGIFNYYTNASINGLIKEIRGADVWCEGLQYGIANPARIDLIDGGTYIGLFYAISCDGTYKGSIGTINKGVFWGKNDVAIRLSYRNDAPEQLILEPDLTSPDIMGVGRYQGGGGRIFNDESRVAFPDYNATNPYRMSKDSDTEAVPAVTTSTGFKYLTFYNPVTVVDSHAIPNGEGEYQRDKTVAIHAGVNSGYRFDGWEVTEGGVTLDSAISETTTFVMPDRPVTVTAKWELLTGTGADFFVTVLNSYSTTDGTGEYAATVPVNIEAGDHPLGYSFAYWDIVDGAGVVFDDATNPNTSFEMPANDVTVRAIWTGGQGFYTVEVAGSYEAPGQAGSGSGGYRNGDPVTVRAGSHPEGYSFAYWYTDGEDVVLSSVTSPTATFTMPARNVRVVAVWTYMPGFHIVTVQESYAAYTGAGGYKATVPVTVYAGLRTGYRFTGWTVHEGGVTLDVPANTIAGFTMPAEDVIVEAHWDELTGPNLYNVKVNNSYAGAGLSGAGDYRNGEVVYLHAGTRSGYTFTGWTVDHGAVTFEPDDTSATTSFRMPMTNVEVTANWYNGGGGGGGTVPTPDPKPDPEDPTEETTEEPPGEPTEETPIDRPTGPSVVTPEIIERPPEPPVPEGKIGEWIWDEDTGTWIFDDRTPMAGTELYFPKTGQGHPALLICLLLLGAGVIARCWKGIRG